jgi:hypothetical protein
MLTTKARDGQQKTARLARSRVIKDRMARIEQDGQLSKMAYREQDGQSTGAD